MTGRGPVRLDPEIRSYYELRPEEDRLRRGVFKLEFERTRELIRRLGPEPPASVLDVGGAAGPYALWLAELGYEVHLVDAVPRLLAVARERAREAGVGLATVGAADARALPFPDEAADVVLLLGPLYHLVESGARGAALAEARRVLRPGGHLFAATITRWASLFDALTFDFFADPEFVELMEEDLRTGRHRNPTDEPSYFTTAYFHTPEEFRDELAAARLSIVGLFGLEGPGRFLADFDERWADPRRRADLMRVAREIESEPSLLGLSPHLLGVARKD